MSEVITEKTTAPIVSYRPDREKLAKPVKVLAVQGGPSGLDKQKNVAEMVDLMRRGLEGLEGFEADFVVFPELGTTMYFAGTTDPTWQDHAETVPGPTTEAFSRLAAEYNTNVVLSLYERGPKSGEFFNSTVFLDRQGEIIPGITSDGRRFTCYRKTHIPNSFAARPRSSEKFFFRPGPALPVFKTDVATVGCLICYDRSFPEAWKVLSLSGAEIVFVPTASPTKRRAHTFLVELQAAAVQNGVFVVPVNKGGLEVLDDERHFFGMTAVIHPESDILVQCPAGEGPVLLRAEFDLGDKVEYNRKYHYYRDRRPELYGITTDVSFV